MKPHLHKSRLTAEVSCLEEEQKQMMKILLESRSCQLEVECLWFESKEDKLIDEVIRRLKRPSC